MTDYQMEEQVSLFDQDLLSTKMCLGLSAPTAAKTSKPSSTPSSKSQTPKLPMCLCLTATNGATPDACTTSWVNGVLLGEYRTDSFGERPNRLTEEQSYPAHPNGVGVSRLSQILVDDAPPKYCLSARACQGILSRAERRGKKLPDELREALEQQISSDPQD